MDPQQEIALGLQSYQQILSQERGNVMTSGPIVDQVQEIGRRLAIEAEKLMVEETGSETGFDWTYSYGPRNRSRTGASRGRAYGAAKPAKNCRRGCFAWCRRYGYGRAESGHGYFRRRVAVWLCAAVFA